MSLRLSAIMCGTATLLAFACHSPSSPSGCENGHDHYGRTPFVYLDMHCAPTGTNLSCRVTWRESGYCADPAVRDVTNEASWLSSDDAIATFRAPGYLQVMAAGEVHIHARLLANPYKLDSNEQAFVVAPTDTPERLARVGVGVQDATRQVFLADARVELHSPRGAVQACQTNQYGHCDFWSPAVPFTLVASKPGYAPSEASVTPSLDCYCSGTLIRLSPAPLRTYGYIR